MMMWQQFQTIFVNPDDVDAVIAGWMLKKQLPGAAMHFLRPGTHPSQTVMKGSVETHSVWIGLDPRINEFTMYSKNGKAFSEGVERQFKSMLIVMPQIWAHPQYIERHSDGEFQWNVSFDAYKGSAFSIGALLKYGVDDHPFFNLLTDWGVHRQNKDYRETIPFIQYLQSRGLFGENPPAIQEMFDAFTHSKGEVKALIRRAVSDYKGLCTHLDRMEMQVREQHGRTIAHVKLPWHLRHYGFDLMERKRPASFHMFGSFLGRHLQFGVRSGSQCLGAPIDIPIYKPSEENEYTGTIHETYHGRHV